MIIQGDALEVLKTLPDSSVHCMVTSPPYYGLRDYGVDGQIGLEITINEYIAKLTAIFSEARRVLRSDGTLWVNISDSYAGSGKGAATHPENASKYLQGTSKGMLGQVKTTKVGNGGCKSKDLMLIPFELAKALRDDGWYLRQDIIWEKPNAMPESVTDRCTKSHEYIFLFSKSKKYYFDYEKIKEPCVGFDKTAPRGSKGTNKPNSGRREGNNKTFRGGGAYTNNQSFDNSAKVEKISVGNTPNETGLRRKRSVWSVDTVGCRDAHFATFPPALIKPCILAGCPEGGIVLDMFFGSGTVGEVATRLSRDFIGIELNTDYIKLAEKRINND